MVNFTRRNLYTRIKRDFGDEGNPSSEDFTKMAVESFLMLMGIKKEDADPALIRDVNEICQDFTTKFRRRWLAPKVNRHFDRLEKYHKDFLDEYFKLPDSKRKEKKVEKNDQKPKDDPKPPQPSNTDKPKKSVKRPVEDGVPFLDKVHKYYDKIFRSSLWL